MFSQFREVNTSEYLIDCVRFHAMGSQATEQVKEKPAATSYYNTFTSKFSENRL